MKHAEEIERIIDTVGKTLESPLSPTQRSRLDQALIKSLDETPNGGNKPQNKQVTILLSDLRGFTALTERLPSLHDYKDPQFLFFTHVRNYFSLRW